jgi:glutaconate CoA-transferase subunit B
LPLSHVPANFSRYAGLPETHGYSEKDVRVNCGFELLRADEIVENQPPTDHELSILREQIDPYRYVIGR